MLTKREVLKNIIANDNCQHIFCEECPYYDSECLCTTAFKDKLARIGAMALIRMFPKKKKFDPSKVLTCVTADLAKVGQLGYFADDLAAIEQQFNEAKIKPTKLTSITSYHNAYRFQNDKANWALFYPIDEE